MRTNKDFGFLVCMLTLYLAGSILLFNGLYPIAYKEKHTPALEKPSSIDKYVNLTNRRRFKRIVIVIVDALRYDFLTEKNMPFAFKSSCEKLKLKVDLPTVTMPRIKSFTGGTLSNFADIVLNLGSSDPMEDSLLHQMKSNGDEIVFAGDGTWINLFPNIFKRQYANKDSFFVKDFYEGDENVTNTILGEVKTTDWNIIIAHYLGLDHIGHVEGSDSPKIISKLREMDEVIRKIQRYVNSLTDMILVTGDHGMRNGGGHGGSSKEELYVPLLIFSLSCGSEISHINEFKQIDVAPTLAALTSSKIPKQSIGCIIPDVIKYLSTEDQLYAYFYNTMHLARKAELKFGVAQDMMSDYDTWLTSAKEMHSEFLKYKRSNGVVSSFLFQTSKHNYIRASREISEKLAESLAFFYYDVIAVGVILSVLVTLRVLSFVLLPNPEEHYFPSFKKCLLFAGCAILITLIGKFFGIIKIRSTASWLIALPLSACIHIIEDILRAARYSFLFKHYARHVMALPIPILACFGFQICALASSSFIEEEHQLWYYFGASLLTGLCITTFTNNVYKRRPSATYLKPFIIQELWNLRSSIAVLLTIALARNLNQTGDKWKHLGDIGDVLKKEDYLVWLSGLFALGLLLLMVFLRRLNPHLQFAGTIIALISVYCYHGMNHIVIFFDSHGPKLHDHVSSKIFWACIAFVALQRCILVKRVKEEIFQLLELLKNNLSCCLLISALLHKPHNVILVPSMLATLEEAYRLCDQLQEINLKYCSFKVLTYKTALTIIISKMFYFYQGNSNSLATIDLNPGYIGQTSYNLIIAVIFVAFNTYNAQINAFQYFIYHMLQRSSETSMKRYKEETIQIDKTRIKTTEDLTTVVCLFTVATMVPTTINLLLLIYFRYHLFIYSVFAPKAFYEYFNVIVFYLNLCLINIYFIILK